MEVPFRPLGKVMEIASSTGLEITYAFDDLFFSEHSVFVIRFDKEKEDKLNLYFNQQCEKKTANAIKQKLFEAAAQQKVQLLEIGKFNLKPIEGKEEIEIEFFENN